MQYIVRLGADIIIKSNRIRARFITRLIHNLRAACDQAGIKVEVQREWSKLFLFSDQPEIIDVIKRVYGVSSVSKIEHVSTSAMDDICKTAHEFYSDKIKGKTFAIRAKRVGKHSYTSLDMAKAAGSALFDGSAGVRMVKPEVELFIEVREDKALFFSERIKGPSGLPLGVSGRVLCLLSGGFDSAIAAWMMQKRGLAMDYLFCNLAGEAYEKNVLGLAKFMSEQWSAGTRPNLFIVDMAPVADEIRSKVKRSYSQIILKRAFYRLAEKVAAKIGAEAILTGEAIGQVSSQTLQNLRSIEHIATLPILRPLLGFDKDDIVSMSRQIGTYAMCSGVQEYCQLVPDKPVTASTIEAADRQEAYMDLGVLDTAIAGIRRFDLQELNAGDLVTPYLYCEEIKSKDIVIDCRPQESFAAWHFEGAVNFEFYELLTDHHRLNKNESYVLYCPVGLQSAVLAERLQKFGFEARSFRGGMNGLKKYLATQSALSN